MEEKIVYLTIDDAPSKDMKKKVDYLVSKGIPAIFFCRGDLTENDPSSVIYAIKKGFVIGNHAYSHRHFSELSLEEARKEIKRTDEIIEEVYTAAKVSRPVKLFRFPYGDKGGRNKEAIQSYLRELGYQQPMFEGINYVWFKEKNLDKEADVYWTYDVEEYRLKKKYKNIPYKIKTFEDVLKKMEEKNVEEGWLCSVDSNEILLMHDHEETTTYFFKIIDTLLAKGFLFKLPGIKF